MNSVRSLCVDYNWVLTRISTEQSWEVGDTNESLSHTCNAWESGGSMFTTKSLSRLFCFFPA